ncbi:cupin domain-containing protein [Heyndrickxia coagulans]|uniref:cupin domain-containing protein n=1 Tax=Heyndrickxia coagulans TaxID=1398 RepID=UPI00062883B7|nr:cupin domain-containing protein [Heyndrickxia coagulans]
MKRMLPLMAASDGKDAGGTAANDHVSAFYFEENGGIPNNPFLPVLIYHGVFKGRTDEIEKVFQKNNWGNNWVWTIFPYHHFHSNSHEVIAVRSGYAKVQLGGPKGKIFTISEGDCVLLPAGTGHKRIESGDGFAVTGGYPGGQDYDTQMKADETLRENIRKTGMPETDPVFGKNGPLFSYWTREPGGKAG